MYSFLSSFLWLFCTLVIVCNSKGLIKFQLYNYQNDDNILSNGGRCDIIGGCDPMFRICIFSKNNCDIFNKIIPERNNQKRISNVFSKDIKVNNLEDSFRVNVVVDDHDVVQTEHIAKFNLIFNISQRNGSYKGPMLVTPVGLNVKLYVKIIIECQENYYGPTCNRLCKPNNSTYICDATGERICTSLCGQFGSCKWKNKEDGRSCECGNSTYGELCQFGDCSEIRCLKKCKLDGSQMMCACTDSDFMKTCQNVLRKTSTILDSTTIADIEKHSTEHYSKYSLERTEISKHSKQEQLTYFEKGPYLIPTIIIICLSIFLCLCLIILFVVIKKWKISGKTKSDGLEGTSPETANKSKLPKGISLGPVIRNGCLPTPPDFEDDITKSQIYNHYSSSIMLFDTEDLKSTYEEYLEPQKGNDENLTCHTIISDLTDTDSMQYNIPRNSAAT